MSLTFGEQRTENEKLYDAVVLERVKRGMEFLEREHGPDWVDKIDLMALDLKDAATCVLGQVYDDEVSLAADDRRTGYEYACDEVLDGQLASDYGFCAITHEWNALQEAWEDMLTPLVKARR